MSIPDKYVTGNETYDEAFAVLAGCPTWDTVQRTLSEYTRAVLLDAADHLDSSERLRSLTDDHMYDINVAADELRHWASNHEVK